MSECVTLSMSELVINAVEAGVRVNSKVSVSEYVSE